MSWSVPSRRPHRLFPARDREVAKRRDHLPTFAPRKGRPESSAPARNAANEIGLPLGAALLNTGPPGGLTRLAVLVATSVRQPLAAGPRRKAGWRGRCT